MGVAGTDEKCRMDRVDVDGDLSVDVPIQGQGASATSSHRQAFLLLGSCVKTKPLVASKIPKIYKILRHIESLNTCMKY